MAITVSLIFQPIWNDLKPYLHVVECAKDGGTDAPRIRIDFLGLPEGLARRAASVTMPCVYCERPNLPLRRREGDEWDRLYYAPTCPIGTRVECSRSRAAALEYERFKGVKVVLPPPAQLSLFR